MFNLLPFEKIMAFSSFLRLFSYLLGAMAASVLVNILRQMLPKTAHEPPVVFRWIPYVGSAVSYGLDPVKFFFRCREKASASMWMPIQPSS